MAARAFWHNNGTWIQGKVEEYLDLQGKVVSLVGGGGKTSLMYHLAKAFQERPTVVMTTTRISRPADVCYTIKDCRRCWDARRYAVCGRETSEEKLTAPDPELMKQILYQANTILIEADGAKHKACKTPAPHEPVLLPESNVVIGVVGLDVLDQPIAEACFRPELVCALLGCSMEHCLNEDDLVKILLSSDGTRKNVGERDYYIVLNKCDDACRLERGKSIAVKLEAQGHIRTVLTKLL